MMNKYNAPERVVPLDPQRSERQAGSRLRAVRKRLRLIAVSGQSGEARAVYEALLLYVNENGACYPSQRRLCDDTKLDRRHLHRGINALTAAGLLRREQRWSEDGGRQSDLYVLVENSRELGAADGAGVAPADGAEDGAGPAPTGGAEDGTIKGETKKHESSYVKPEATAAGRCAPFCSPNEAFEPLGISDPSAYKAAIKVAKRQSWLRTMGTWAGESLHGQQRWAAWEAIHEAQQRSRAEMSPENRKLLDQLDRQRRAVSSDRLHRERFPQ